jgi:uncharacterized protein
MPEASREQSGDPWIRGYRCPDCAAVATAPTLACPRCFSRSAPEPFRAAVTGRLFTWSVIERSYPGIEVPFISAIIDLDDGLTLKGTLHAPRLESLHQGLPVALLFDDANGTRDESGAGYVGYHFVVKTDE